MNNWSVDEEKLKKNPQKYAIWRLGQIVNFGLGNERINEADYRRYAEDVVIQDPWRKKYLDLLVYGEKNSN